ncbi:hypothetical protein FOHLNKBM_3651 [Methylobacterium longum]|nr:hypothetical protein FOHLNKBM_3651 [Methylobacterium longum]
MPMTSVPCAPRTRELEPADATRVASGCRTGASGPVGLTPGRGWDRRGLGARAAAEGPLTARGPV